jgi:hypothetical protein
MIEGVWEIEGQMRMTPAMREIMPTVAAMVEECHVIKPDQLHQLEEAVTAIYAAYVASPVSSVAVRNWEVCKVLLTAIGLTARNEEGRVIVGGNSRGVDV